MQGASSTPHFGQEKGGALKAQGHNRMATDAFGVEDSLAWFYFFQD